MALVEVRNPSSGLPMIPSGEVELMESTIQVDRLPSGQSMTRISEGIKSPDTAALMDLSESIGQVMHLNDGPVIGSKSSEECEPDDACIHHLFPTSLLSQESKPPTAGKSVEASVCQPLTSA
jgi:hypothetical protein